MAEQPDHLNCALGVLGLALAEDDRRKRIDHFENVVEQLLAHLADEKRALRRERREARKAEQQPAAELPQNVVTFKRREP